MTTKTFQEFFSENLAGFGWTLSPNDIPDFATYTAAMERIGDWWESLGSHNRNVLRAGDFSQGLHAEGYFNTFPGLYTLFAGNPMGAFDKTFNEITACGTRANYQVGEQTETFSNVLEVVS
jgi:hypothetical protein